ncbi:MAG: TonB C-terminal domain-containing protein [Thermodesulfovibrionales bacterium]|nr:TonB C-terminal domain-containing protein [Thermodesulfovibrionales bacterium]
MTVLPLDSRVRIKKYRTSVAFEASLRLMSFAFSFFLHLFIAGMILLFQSKTLIKERERFITVSILKGSQVFSPESGIKGELQGRASPSAINDSEKGKTESLAQDIADQIVEERLHAIRAKKRIEKIARLRTVITQEGNQSEYRGQKSESKERAESRNNLTVASSQSSLSEYTAIIAKIIRTNWHYPEIARKGLTGTVIIYVGRDGVIKTIDFKTSGDRLFDYSLKNALQRSSPLPPPPEELEIELRFTR